MVSEELSQEDIDKLFSNNSNDNKQVSDSIKEFANLLNTSIEKVLKTAFSLEIVSKFIDLQIKQKDEIDVSKYICVKSTIKLGDSSLECYAVTNKEFASIIADLMLMGPGEAKDKLEPDDFDALKELFSQVFGSFQVDLKEKSHKECVFNVQDVKEGIDNLNGDIFYCMDFDIAIPDVKDDVVTLIVQKPLFDQLFENSVREPGSVDEVDEIESEKLPFENLEEAEEHENKPAGKETEALPNNLDIIMDVELDVKIRIGEKSMLIKDVLDLKEGSIVELEKDIEEPMEILINNKVVARGVAVVVGGRFGVKIIDIDTKEERIKSLGG